MELLSHQCDGRAELVLSLPFICMAASERVSPSALTVLRTGLNEISVCSVLVPG